MLWNFMSESGWKSGYPMYRPHPMQARRSDPILSDQQFPEINVDVPDRKTDHYVHTTRYLSTK